MTSFSGTLLFASILHFFSFLKIYRIVNFFWKNLLVNEFWTAMGGGLLGISKIIILILETQQKMVTNLDNLQSWDPSLHFRFLNCPNFVTLFCQVLKMEIIFFYIPSNPLPIAVRNSLTKQFFQKN